jgi:hypothetical protein
MLKIFVFWFIMGMVMALLGIPLLLIMAIAFVVQFGITKFRPEPLKMLVHK